MDHGFDFIVGGIEDGFLAALSPLRMGEPDGYLRTLDAYSGELDTDQVRRALGDITPLMPAMLIAYGSGEDTLDPATPAVGGEPRIYRHDCSFTVICLSDDSRSETARRRGSPTDTGIYRMIEDARATLGGLRFKAVNGEQKITLNGEPLRYDGVEYMARMPEMTAYAVHFSTYFRYSEPDRRVIGPKVLELVFDIETLNPGSEQPGNLPGVTRGKKSGKLTQRR